MISLTNAKRKLDGFPTIAALPPLSRIRGGVSRACQQAGGLMDQCYCPPVPPKSLIWRPRRRRRRAIPRPQYPRPPADRARRCPRKRRPRRPARRAYTDTPRIYRVVRPNPVPSMRDHPSRKQSIITWNSGLTRGQMNAGRSKAMPMAGETVRMAAIRPTASNPLDGWQGRRRRHDACAPSPASRSLRYISGMSRSWSWSLAQTTGLPAASERGTSRMRWFLDPRNCRRESCWSLR